jgi:hypothetical protein
VNTLLTLFLFVIAFLSLHFGLGLVVWPAVIIAAVLALMGCLLIVVVFDGDGDLW